MNNEICKRHSTRLAVVLSIATLLTLAGCGKSATSGSAPSSGSSAHVLQIAVIPKGTSHEYWKSIHAGALKAQQELGAKGTKINVLWKGTETEGDRNGQVNIVETFVTQHVDGIALAPLDSQALVTPVHDAVSRKIPVVIIDSQLKGNDWSSFVATNNEKGGEIAGQQLAQLLGGKGNVIMLAYAQGSASTEDRERGFMAVMKKYPGIAVLSSNQYGGPTTDTAYKTSQNLLARYGSQLNGVFASNESNTRGMRLALKDANLLHKVKFVGFDAVPDLIAALKAGEIQGIVAQDPFRMGYEGVTTLVDVINGKSAPKTLDTGVAFLTAATVDSPANEEFVNPPLNKYLQ